MGSGQENRQNFPLQKKLGIIIACKLVLIFVLWFSFFGPDKRPEQTPEAVAAGILKMTATPLDSQKSSL